MSTDKLESSVAVLAPVVEITEASLRQLLPPLEKMDQKDLSIPIFHSAEADFYNFSFNNNTLTGGADFGLEAFLSLPFSAEEVMAEGGGEIVFHQHIPDIPEPEREEEPQRQQEEGGSGETNEDRPEQVPTPDEEIRSVASSSPVIVDDSGNSVIIRKKVYECQEPGCDVWFARASRFHEHTLTHKDVRPFRCSACSYKTKWKSDVNKHIKKQISKGDQTHNNGRMLVAHEYEKDKMKLYNLYHVERLIYCTDGTNKIPETGNSRHYVRDPSDPKPPPPSPLVTPTIKSKGNGKNKKRKIESGSPDKSETQRLSNPHKVVGNNCNGTGGGNQISLTSIAPRVQVLSGLDFETLLGLGPAQNFNQESEPLFLTRTLPVPAQEFTHLVGFNKY